MRLSSFSESRQRIMPVSPTGESRIAQNKSIVNRGQPPMSNTDFSPTEFSPQLRNQLTRTFPARGDTPNLLSHPLAARANGLVAV